MDVDLSTDLDALLPLVAPLLSGHSDLAIGTRLAPAPMSYAVRSASSSPAPTTRCSTLTLRTRFSDAQCGFKAIRAEHARELLPLVEDTGWFFDTELLVLAERAGLRIHEVPVDWVDDPDSRVDIVATAFADLKGVGRVGRGLATGSVPIRACREPARARRRGARVRRHGRPAGAVRRRRRRSAPLRTRCCISCCGRSWPAQAANALSLLAHRHRQHCRQPRLTFGVRGRDGVLADQCRACVTFALGLAADQWLAGVAAPGVERAGPRARRARRPHARQRRARPSCGSCSSAGGCSVAHLAVEELAVMGDDCRGSPTVDRSGLGCAVA